MSERPIRRAASVVCVRAGGDGRPEVLVVERSAASRFLPGYVAFPGGAVDADDEERAGRWFGDREEASRAAAIREVVEEVGLALTAAGFRASTTLAPSEADPPPAAALSPLCHWIAPEDVPVRFDARYFVVAAGGDVDAVADGAEVADAWWVEPAVLLTEWEQGKRKLYWPTWLTVSHLATCGSVAAVLAASFETRDPTPDEEVSMPRHVMEQE